MSNTALKGYTTPATSAEVGTWGEDLNTNFQGIVDTNMAGLLTLALSSTNYSLTTSDVQNAMFRLTGTLLANIVLSPAGGALFNGFYYWENVTSGSFTITVTTGAGSVVLPQSRRGVLFVDGTNGPRIVGIVGTSSADPIPVGSKTIWCNAAAPAGWSAQAVNDYAVQIVTEGSGGQAYGTVAYSTLFARTATDSHVLTSAELAGHSHTYGVTYGTAPAGGNQVASVVATTGPTTITTSSTGGGSGHTHGLDMRVLTTTFTLCVKN